MQQRIIDAILTDFVCTEKKKRAVDTLFQYLYFNLGEFGIYYAEEDARSDFLLWLYPKLPGIIGKYNSELSVFFTYLRMSVKFHWQLFERKNRQQASYTDIAEHEQQHTAEYKMEENASVQNYELYAASPLPDYKISPEKEQAIKRTILWESKKKQLYQRRLLLLACKSCFFIDEHFINHLAAALEMPAQDIRAAVDEAKKQAAAKEAAYADLAAKRDFYYMRYKSASVQLCAVDTAHTALYARLKVQQSYNYTLWQRYLKRTQEYQRVPSNRKLAKQFGLSRGTVDNNLAAVKKACYCEP
ncbi:MAG: hypothetical protein P1P65_05405 [Treponema sp.]